jgi:hypothetical protein
MWDLRFSRLRLLGHSAGKSQGDVEIRTSETSVSFNDTTRHYIPECCRLQILTYQTENPISRLNFSICIGPKRREICPFMAPRFPEHPIIHQSIDVTDIDWVHCVAVRWNFWEHFYCNISRPIKDPPRYCFIKLNSNFITFLGIGTWDTRGGWASGIGHAGRLGIGTWTRGERWGGCVQTGSEAHSASCTMGTGGPFPGGKAQPVRDADHSLLLVPGSKRVGAILPLTLMASMVSSGTSSRLLIQITVTIFAAFPFWIWQKTKIIYICRICIFD